MTLSQALRLAVAISLTAYILWNADPAHVAEVAGGADLSWIGLAVALVLVDRALMAYRWVALLVALSPESRPPLADVLRIFLVSTFVGTFLPSVGGDVYRAYSLSRLRVSGAESAASVLMDRLLGVLSIVIAGASATLAFGRDWLDSGMVIGLAAAAAVCALAAAAVFSERAARWAQRAASGVPGLRLQRLSVGLVEAVRGYANHHGALASVLLMSIAVQAIRVLQAWSLGLALGIPAPLPAYFIFIPIILLVMLLPVTINGLGTGQVAFDALFGRIGVSGAESFALSVLFIALGIIGNLPGGVIYAMGPRQPSEQHVP